MIITHSGVDDFLSILQKAATAFTIAVAILIILFWWFVPAKRVMEFSGPQNLAASFNHQVIGRGPLALQCSDLPPLLDALKRELALLGKSSRPDHLQHGQAVQLGLVREGSLRLVKEGELVYLDLKCDMAGRIENVHFANEPTGIWVKLSDDDEKSLAVEVGPAEKLAGVEKRHFFLTLESNAIRHESEPWQIALKNGRALGYDLFFETYGGAEYKPLAKKQKVELVAGDSTYILYIQNNDLLSWREGRWHPAHLSEADPKAPLAKVKNAAGTEITLELWDATGFEKQEIKLPLTRVANVQKPENFIGLPRLRSANQVTAFMGKKRVLLKPGDWWLKTKNGWRNLKSSAEIEAYLNHRISGDLCVIEGISKQTAHAAIWGRLFNDARTQMDTFSLPVPLHKKTDKSKKRKGI